MNNNIQEDYCSFEVSKLLTEKGAMLHSERNTWVLAKDKELGEAAHFTTTGHTEFDNIVSIDEERYHNAYHVLAHPTHSLAIKWIRKNFNIYFSFGYHNNGNNFWFEVSNPDRKSRGPYIQKDYKEHLVMDFNTPEEATEAALLYTLKHLI